MVLQVSPPWTRCHKQDLLAVGGLVIAPSGSILHPTTTVDTTVQALFFFLKRS